MNVQTLTQNNRKNEPPHSVQTFQYKNTFQLESGATLPELTIAYQTWGQLNPAGDNVIWLCHALTANANAADWWAGLLGEGRAFDTSRYFVVCANILGSCYGTTGPSSTDPLTGQPYFHRFPFITIRDMVQAHNLLGQHLGVRRIHLLAGGSMGGYQALEWAVMQPALIQQLFLLTTSARESAWGIAIHTAQRMAIENDGTWKLNSPAAGINGLKTARAIGMLTYRSYASFVEKQTDPDNTKLDDFRASSYMRYQGEKLAARFTAHSYWLLTKAMDSHNLGRGRGSLSAVLQTIRAKTLVLGITSDLLCPVQELQYLAQHIPDSSFVAIDSLYGHDGFLVETEAITHHLTRWLTA